MSFVKYARGIFISTSKRSSSGKSFNLSGRRAAMAIADEVFGVPRWRFECSGSFIDNTFFLGRGAIAVQCTIARCGIQGFELPTVDV